MTFAFIAAEKAHHPVRTLCRVLDVSASGFYAAQQGHVSPRTQQDRALRAHLVAAYRTSRGSYGSPRLQQALRAAGYRIGRHRVMRLMREADLVGRRRRRFRATTTADPTATPAPNVLNQQFAVAAPNRVWAADITALPTDEGWLYLAVVLDLFSRRVVGWATASTLEASLAVAAYRRAVTRRRTAPRLHHSDRGSQYTSAVYQRLLRAAGVRCSMSRRGNCYDNAVVESFFRTLKSDLGDTRSASRAEAHQHVEGYIDGFYNPRRLHSTLGYRSPIAFERALRRAC